MIVNLLVASVGLLPPQQRAIVGATPRRAFVGSAAAALFVSIQPVSAASDCMKTCVSNCDRVAPGSGSYCKDSCVEYCAQEDRKDGLSGSVSTEGAEFGFASSFKLPNAPQKVRTSHLLGLNPIYSHAFLSMSHHCSRLFMAMTSRPASQTSLV